METGTMSRTHSYDELVTMVHSLEVEKRRSKSDFIRKAHESEQKYHAMLDTVDAYMCLVSPDFKLVWANKKTREIFGEDIVGKHCHQACYSADDHCGKANECLVRQAFQDGEVRKHETEFIAKDGSVMYLSGTAKVISWDNNGYPSAVVKIYYDITEQKQAANELQESLERLRKNLSGTIQAMAMTVETRDPYTAGHQRRTSDIARCIAHEMGLSSEQVDGIRMAGVIHDLGKISVPAEILSKPGTIGETEYSLIKDHPQTGYDILKGIDFNWPVAEIVRQHHERMDGSGYPFGLSGNDILLEARVIGVADVIEAMSSHRPYRPALGVEKAFDEIEKKRGTLYDPNVVDATVKLFKMEKLQFH